MFLKSMVVVAMLAVVLTACSPSSPERTPPSSPAPSSAEPSSPAPSDDPPSAATEFTPPILADLCIEKTREYYGEVEFAPDEVRVEQRKVDPPWLVIVPSRTQGADYASVCTIGGTPEEPVFQAHAAQPYPTDQEIQDSIDGVEYYSGD